MHIVIGGQSVLEGECAHSDCTATPEYIKVFIVVTHIPPTYGMIELCTIHLDDIKITDGIEIMLGSEPYRFN